MSTEPTPTIDRRQHNLMYALGAMVSEICREADSDEGFLWWINTYGPWIFREDWDEAAAQIYAFADGDLDPYTPGEPWEPGTRVSFSAVQHATGQTKTAHGVVIAKPWRFATTRLVHVDGSGGKVIELASDQLSEWRPTR